MKLRLAIILVVLGGMLGFYAIQEWRLGAMASATPQEISLQDLIARGPGDNAHVVLKDYVLCQNYIYSKKENSTSWDEVWIPVVPVEALAKVPTLKVGPGAPPLQQQIGTGNIQAIIKSSKVHNENDLDRLGERTTLQGMVVNKISSLGSKERDKLVESYPGTDFDRCLIIEDGRTPSGMGKVMGCLGGAALMLLGGIGLALVGFIRK